MSLLYKTISSFFPCEAQCAFAREQWFITNHELQLDVLRLCQAGYASVFFTPMDSHTFKQHVMCCMRRYIDETYYPNNYNYYSRLVDYLTSSIPNGDYLLTRGWFCRSPYRHVNVFLIELNGCSNMIFALAGDFDEHIESIAERILRCYAIFGNKARSSILAGECSAILKSHGDEDNEDYDDYDDDDDYDGYDYEYDDYYGYDENDENDDYDGYDYDASTFADYYETRNSEVDNVPNVANVDQTIIAYLFKDDGSMFALTSAGLKIFLENNKEQVEVVAV
jgi:hypothetical protein